MGEKGMEGKKRVVEMERRKRVKKGGQGEEARCEGVKGEMKLGMKEKTRCEKVEEQMNER